jgi:hypothetical protein
MPSPTIITGATKVRIRAKASNALPFSIGLVGQGDVGL